MKLTAFKFLFAISCIVELTSACKTSVVKPKESKQLLWDHATNALKRGEWDDSIDFFSEIIASDKNSVDAYDGRAVSYVFKGMFDEAMRDYSLAIRLKPENATDYVNRGNVYALEHQFTRAFLDFGEALSISPSNTFTYSSRARAYSSISNFVNALEDLNACLRINPADGSAYRERAWANLALNKWQDAMQDYTEAIRLNSSDASSYNDLSWILATCSVDNYRDGAAAVKYGEKACDLTKWANWKFIDTLSAAYAECGDFGKALDYEKLALRLGGMSESERRVVRDHMALYNKQRTE